MTKHSLRANYTDQTIRVYQAYPPEIAGAALRAGRFVPPFKMERMTWIKPSFNWMMYRCGFASKPGQECVLAIDIARSGFNWALEHAVLSGFSARVHGTHENWHQLVRECPVRVQWDPERDWRLSVVEGVRAIQIGLSGEAVERYVKDWVVRIDDITELARAIDDCRRRGVEPDSLPDRSERPYPVSAAVQESICRE